MCGAQWSWMLCSTESISLYFMYSTFYVLQVSPFVTPKNYNWTSEKNHFVYCNGLSLCQSMLMRAKTNVRNTLTTLFLNIPGVEKYLMARVCLTVSCMLMKTLCKIELIVYQFHYIFIAIFRLKSMSFFFLHYVSVTW